MAPCVPCNAQAMVTTVLELGKVLLRLDMPSAAVEQFTSALQAHPSDTSLLLGLARCHDGLGDTDAALQVWLCVRVCVGCVCVGGCVWCVA